MSLANRVILIAVLSASAFLLLYNLGNEYLWQDEAETAILARNVLRFGLPQAYDGKNTVLILEIPEFSKNYLFGKYWMGQPWLAIYIASLSFGMFGINTFAARLPFALIGLASVLLVYLLAQKLYRNRAVSNISALLAAFSVPLILHMRQCRYYSPGIFLTLLCVYLYLRYIEKRPFSSASLLISLFFLLNASISYFLGVAVAIIAHMFLRGGGFSAGRNLRFLAAFLLFSAPILFLFKLQRRLELDAGWILHNIRFYVRAINKFIFPWRSAIAIYAIYAFRKRRLAISMPEEERNASYLLALVIVSTLLFLPFVNMNSLRYIIHIAPLFFILEAYLLYRLINRFRHLTICIVIPLAIFTNIFSFSLPVRAYLADYIYEITHDYDGPAEGITAYLKNAAAPGDTVKVGHRFDNPIIFYTDLKVDNMPPFGDEAFPEWIVPSSYWNGDFYGSDYYRKVKERYDEIVLPYPDIPWENRPDDMGYHKFATDKSAPMVKIYKRR